MTKTTGPDAQGRIFDAEGNCIGLVPTGDSHTTNQHAHKWSDCDMCGRMVVCGKCGNNCCNGGYGTVDGIECDACPSAYDMQDRGEKMEIAR